MTLPDRAFDLAAAARDRAAAGSGSGADPRRQGEGVTDTSELARLIDLLRSAERADSAAQARTIQIGEFLVDGTRVPKTFLAPLQSMTRTEAAVVRFLGWGRANADIAVLLSISESTVRSHFNNVINKLNVDGMRELNSIAGLLFHPVE